MRSRAYWHSEIDRLNREAIARAEIALRREFARLRLELMSLPDVRAHDVVVRRHATRLALLLGFHGQLTANAFALLAWRMIGPRRRNGGVKAQPPAKREIRIAEVLAALARTIVSGPLARIVAEELAQNAMVVATVEAAIASAPADASAAVIAANLLESRNISARLAQAAAAATQHADTPRNPATAASGPGRAITPPSGGRSPPPAGDRTGGGGPPPKRSRFSLLIERIVREEAPARARRIATTSGRLIGDVLARAAAEGWGEEKIRKALEQAIGDEVAGYRARRIARTEMGGGQNGATFAIARDRAAAGEDLDKVWITTVDGRERRSHHDLNLERQPLEERFSNGLLHPHEFGAALAEIVNCRCGLMIRRRQSDAPPSR